MANVSELNLTSNSETNNFSNYYGMREVTIIITIIINGITCPLTVLLNVLVIMAVKRRPRLQTNTNISLACLAATDIFTGLTAQPSYILYQTLELLGESTKSIAVYLHNFFLRFLGVCSLLHLALVTGERLVAIKFTMRYPYLVTKRNMKLAVFTLWVFLPSCEAFVRLISDEAELVKLGLRFLIAFVMFSCVLFISSAYAILYRETLRHRKMIKAEQLPQGEVERFLKESKALKTTVFVVGAVVLCFVPAIFYLLLEASVQIFHSSEHFNFLQWVRTFVMLNSFLNPLIYCWRLKEMRRFVFRTRRQPVAVDYLNQWKEKADNFSANEVIDVIPKWLPKVKLKEIPIPS